MRYTLRLEWIGKFGNKRRAKPWVAELVAWFPGGFDREFLQGQNDYSRCNGTGSRGVMLYFHLQPGLYEVSEPVSWNGTNHFYLSVSEDGKAAEITLRQVVERLKEMAGNRCADSGSAKNRESVRRIPQDLCELFRRKGFIRDDSSGDG